MLAGKRLFEGETVGDTLAAVLTKTPDLAALPAAAPMGLRQLVARCLDRDLSTRLRDIGEARIALTGDLRTTPPVSIPGSRAGLPRLAFVGAMCTLVAGAITWVAVGGRSAALPAVPPTCAVIAPRPGGAVIRTPAVSPDAPWPSNRAGGCGCSAWTSGSPAS